MGLNVPLVFDEMHGNNVSNCPTFMPIHCNLNVRPKVQCKPSCVSTSLTLLGFLVSCPFLGLLLDASTKCLQCHVRL